MTEKFTCSVCGNEFEFNGEERLAAWMKKNPDKVKCPNCYGKTATSKTSAKKADAPAKTNYASKSAAVSEITAELLRKAYDEVLAAFADVHDDVKEYIGGWTTTIALSKSKAR